jgi:PEP-CTERM motif
MRRFILSFAALVAVCASANAQIFTPGNLIVLRVGDGTTTLGTGTIQTSLVQFDQTGLQIGSPFLLPTAGGTPLTNTGNSTTEGALSLSTNGQFLVFGSYLSAPGVVASTATAATVQRAIVQVDSAGNISSFGLGSTAFSASNIRSAAATNATNMWASGNSGTGTSAGTGGTWYTNGTTPAQISNTQNNSRVASIFNNTLYYSSGSATGGAIGINSLGSPPPTSGPVTPTGVINGVAGQLTGPNQFVLSPGPLAAGSFAYVADQGAAASAIQRFNFDGTSWTLAYNIAGAATTSGVAVDFSGAMPHIFATAPTGLFSLIDAGIAGQTLTSIATPGANFAFRGVSFAPVPEPTSLLAVATGTLLFGRWVRRRKAK